MDIVTFAYVFCEYEHKKIWQLTGQPLPPLASPNMTTPNTIPPSAPLEYGNSQYNSPSAPQV